MAKSVLRYQIAIILLSSTSSPLPKTREVRDTKEVRNFMRIWTTDNKSAKAAEDDEVDAKREVDDHASVLAYPSEEEEEGVDEEAEEGSDEEDVVPFKDEIAGFSGSEK